MSRMSVYMPYYSGRQWSTHDRGKSTDWWVSELPRKCPTDLQYLQACEVRTAVVWQRCKHSQRRNDTLNIYWAKPDCSSSYTSPVS